MPALRDQGSRGEAGRLRLRQTRTKDAKITTGLVTQRTIPREVRNCFEAATTNKHSGCARDCDAESHGHESEARRRASV